MFEHGFPQEWSTLKKLIWLRGAGIAGASYIWKTVTGSLIHITDALASPMQKCEVSLEPIQAGSGDPSPDNVRPITGWTGCEATRTGKNLLNTSNAGHNSYNIGGIPNTLKPNTTYTFSINGTNIGFKYALYLATSGTNYNSTARRLSNTYIDGGNSSTFTTPSDMTDQWLILAGNSATAGDKPIDVILPQIELGSATPYEPYSDTTASVTFPETVYGGKYEFVSGNGDSKLAIVDLGSLSWQKYAASGNWIFYANVPNGRTSVSGGSIELLCSAYPCSPTSKSGSQVLAGDDKLASWDSTNSQILIKDLSISDATSFKTAMSGIQLVYELAEPIEISLTPQEISTLKGENNVWSNSNGDTTVIYKAQA